MNTQKVIDSAKKYGIDPAMGLAFIEVESGGLGFAKDTGKIIIQFEPSWFKKKATYAPSGAWSLNGVERQSAEWLAFNNAFKLNPDAAMESTSIGMGQIMGFHYKRLGFKTVGEMWDDAKKGEANQIDQIFKFIATSPDLLKAIQIKNFHLIAGYYNGFGYKELAKKIGREPYDISIEKSYNKWRAHV